MHSGGDIPGKIGNMYLQTKSGSLGPVSRSKSVVHLGGELSIVVYLLELDGISALQRAAAIVDRVYLTSH